MILIEQLELHSFYLQLYQYYFTNHYPLSLQVSTELAYLNISRANKASLYWCFSRENATKLLDMISWGLKICSTSNTSLLTGHFFFGLDNQTIQFISTHSDTWASYNLTSFSIMSVFPDSDKGIIYSKVN